MNDFTQILSNLAYILNNNSKPLKWVGTSQSVIWLYNIKLIYDTKYVIKTTLLNPAVSNRLLFHLSKMTTSKRILTEGRRLLEILVSNLITMYYKNTLKYLKSGCTSCDFHRRN